MKTGITMVYMVYLSSFLVHGIVKSWFTTPMNTSSLYLPISTINHRIQPLVRQLNAILGAPSFRFQRVFLHGFQRIWKSDLNPNNGWMNMSTILNRNEVIIPEFFPILPGLKRRTNWDANHPNICDVCVCFFQEEQSGRISKPARFEVVRSSMFSCL